MFGSENSLTYIYSHSIASRSMSPDKSHRPGFELKTFHQTCIWIGGFLAVLSATAWVYTPGLTGPLLLDDNASLSALGAGVNDWKTLLAFVFGNESGPTGRPVAMLTFLIDGQSWPVDAARFKQTNIILHLVIGTLVAGFTYVLVSIFSKRKIHTGIVALLVATIWLLHPLNVSTVLYVVQRMAQLSMLFSLCSLVLFMLGRQLVLSNERRAMLLLGLSTFPCALLAVISKETGVLVFVCIAMMEWTLFSRLDTTRLYRIWYKLAVVVPVSLLMLYIVFGTAGTYELYDYRHFGIFERLLTECRVMALYLANIGFPKISAFTLYHDGFSVSSSLFNPLTTLFSLLALGILIAVSVKQRASQPILSFAILWFFVWHLLESTFLPLELYFEHRNYMPMLGPVLAVCYYGVLALSRMQLPHGLLIGSVLTLCIALVSALMTYQLTNLWGNSGALISHWAAEHPESKRAQTDVATLLGELGRPDLGLNQLRTVSSYYPNEVTLMLNTWNYSCRHGIQPPQTMNQIAQHKSLRYQYDDINYELRVLVDNVVQSSCGLTDRDDSLALLERVGTLPMQTRDRVVYNIIYSELLVFYQEYDAALKKLDLAYSLEPTADIAIRQSSLAGSVGKIDLALEIIENAYAANDNRRFFALSREAEINRLHDTLMSVKRRNSDARI